MTFSVKVQLAAQITRTISESRKNIDRKAADAVNRAVDWAEDEFKSRAAEQVALSPGDINSRVTVKKSGHQAELIVSAEPIPLEYYPHRAVDNGVVVVVNHGQPAFIPGARIVSGGAIVLFENGSSRRLYGPSPDQIAKTEFADIAVGTRRELLESLS